METFTGPLADRGAALVREAATPLTGHPDDYDALIERSSSARLVLLGEATHGTREFYAERAAITRRLIEEAGFVGVAAEADWPDAARVNAYVQGEGTDSDARSALSAFERFPTWMWANTEVEAFAEWLRGYNASRPQQPRVGFYGLDLYSLHRSMTAVIAYLDRVDPAAAARARARYACFDHVSDADGQRYGYAAAFGSGRTCEDEVVAQLMDLQRRAAEYASRDGLVAQDAAFHAEQNARLVADAERYYRTMFTGRVSSWNERDRHMTDTLDALLAHLELRHGTTARVVVWAHNSHLGDARATEMGAVGELNVGQLVRERHPGESLHVGFTTYDGMVTAADDWDGPARTKRVRPALSQSYEAAFHASGIERFLRAPSRHWALAAELSKPPLERAIGVGFQPDTERVSHYFSARLTEQFDVVAHFDRTEALEPLVARPRREDDLAETFPSSL